MYRMYGRVDCTINVGCGRARLALVSMECSDRGSNYCCGASHMIIVYTDRCLKCTERQQWNRLRRLALSRGVKLQERRTDVNEVWLHEAEQYEISMPFIVNGKQAISFNEPLDKLEET